MSRNLCSNKAMFLSELRKSKKLEFSKKENLYDDTSNIPTVTIYLKENHKEYFYIIFNQHCIEVSPGEYEITQEVPTMEDDIENLAFTEVENHFENIDNLLKVFKDEFGIEFDNCIW